MPVLHLRPIVRSAAVGMALLAAVVLFYWKLTLTAQYTWLDSPDFAYQVLPWYQFQAGEWHAGRIPLWSPYEWAGHSLVGQAQPGVAYPLNWALFLMPLRQGWMRMLWLNWYWVLIHSMAVGFGYWLCRDLGRSRLAAALGGLAFGVGGWMGSTEWPQMLNGAVWLPVVVMFLLRVLRGEHCTANAGLAGAALGMAFLSGHHQAPTFIALVAGGLWLYTLARCRRRALVPLAAFGLVCALVAAVQVLPAVEYGRLAVRWVGSAHDPVGWRDPVPYRVHERYGLFAGSLIGIAVPGVYRNANPYIGLAVLSLALVAAVARAAQREVRLLAAIALGGLLFSLSQYSLLHGILYALAPMVEKARNPSMAIVVFHFGVAVLAAFGLDVVRERDEAAAAWIRRAALALAVFGVFFAALVFVLRNSPGVMERERFRMVPGFAASAAGLLYGSTQVKRGRSALACGLLLVALAEAQVGGSTWGWRRRGDPGSLLPQMAAHADVAQWLSRQPGPPRIEIDAEAVPYNFGEWYGIDTFDTYTASLQANIHHLQADTAARMLFGIGWSVGTKPRRQNQVEVFASASGLKIWANPEAAPRVWTAHEAETISADQVPFVWARGVPALRARPFLTTAVPALERCGGRDRPALLLREASRIQIDAEMACAGLLISTESYFPGWRATVDGRAVPIHEVYAGMRAVVVPGGHHRVEFLYRPVSVIAGAVATALGLLLALLCAVQREILDPGGVK